MGYDAFGLPAETTRSRPVCTRASPRTSRSRRSRGLSLLGSWEIAVISIDWSREFATHEPTYYRWTQWIFLRLYERGLAYRKEAAVNCVPTIRPCWPTSR